MYATSYARTTALSAANDTDSSDDEKGDADFMVDSRAYFGILNDLTVHAKKIRLDETKHEENLFDYLPVNERFSLNKEGKVLTKWQERQSDWERIQKKLSKKLGIENRPLMMTTTDEYRSKAEEYDLIQAAIPVKDRYASQAWQLTLREGGPIRIAVGHLFSGIECEYSPHFKAPKMVRKPKAPELTFKNDTFVEETVALIEMKAKYSKRMTEIRPRDLSYSDASHLVVRSSDLFEWAKNSSEQYFQEQRESDMPITDDASSIHSLHSSESGLFDEFGPHIEFLSPKDVLFTSKPNEDCIQTVRFKNAGPVAITYEWSKLAKTEGASKSLQPNSKKSATVSDTLTAKNGDNGKLRNHLLNKNRDSFFCTKSKGTILPDEIISTAFTFSSRAGGGTYHNTWQLMLNPLDSVILHKADDPMAVEGEPPASFLGSFIIKLRAVCAAPDYTVAKRRDVGSFFEQKSIETMVLDIIYDSMKRVRAAVRMSDLQSRQISLFLKLNAGNLNRLLSDQNSPLLPVYIVPERLAMLSASYVSAQELHSSVYESLNVLQKEKIRLISSSEEQEEKKQEGEQEEKEGMTTASTPINPFILTEAKLAELRFLLFPEATIEVFDEVEESQLMATWDYSLSTLLDGLEAMRMSAVEVSALQDEIDKIKIAQEKEVAKKARQEARCASGDDDDEDEEEEEEEEDDDEEKPVPSKHPLIITVETEITSVKNVINLSFVRFIDESTLSSSIQACLAPAMDKFPDLKEKALKEADLYDISLTDAAVITPLASPFTSIEGYTQWNTALTQETVEGIIDPKAKKPAKGKGPAVATPEQINWYYKQMVGFVKDTILDAMINDVFVTIDKQMNEDNASIILVNRKVASEKLFDIAAIRPDDVSTGDGQVVFINFNGDAFTLGSTVKSAFDTVQRCKVKSVEAIAKAVHYGAKAVVLVYESTNAATPDRSLLQYSAELKELIEKARKGMQDADIVKKKAACKTAIPRIRYQEEIITFKALQLVPLKSCGELNYTLTALSDRDTMETIPVLILDNIAIPGVVPLEPDYEEVESDDDEAPICIGLQESHLTRRLAWEKKRPHRVQVSVNSICVKPIAKPSSSDAVIGTLSIGCYADASAAIMEAYALSSSSTSSTSCTGSSTKGSSSGGSGGSSSGVMWVDASPSTMFSSVSGEVPSSSAFHGIHRTVSNRFVSDELRELFLWSGVVSTLPSAIGHVSTVAAAAVAVAEAEAADAIAAQAMAEGQVGQVLEEGSTPIEPIEPVPTTIESASTSAPVVEVSLLSKHIGSLYPYSVNTCTAPKSLLIIGGDVRADKFRFMDEAIDLVDEIYVCGDMCIPFIMLLTRFVFVKYEKYAMYSSVCASLLKKARFRGCKLVWPVDVLSCDELCTKEALLKAYENILADARNEGIDYEGEIKTVSFTIPDTPDEFIDSSEVESPATVVGVQDKGEKIKVDGYIYDIGPSACIQLKESIAATDMLLVWGTVGACEASTFQTGQQTLVDAANQKTANLSVLPTTTPDIPAATIPTPTPTPTSAANANDVVGNSQATMTKNPLRTIVVGESSVEWFTRLADPDGELDGNLVSAGVVQFTHRKAEVVTGLMGMFPSPLISQEGALRYRSSTVDEWVYSVVKDDDDEEEEEEEEEDNEED